MTRRATALRRSAPVFAALGDDTRLRLVERLGASRPLSIAALTEGTELTRQAVTKHLRVLAEAGIVRDSQQGRERLWALEPASFEEARAALETISQRWDAALDRLARHLKR